MLISLSTWIGACGSGSAQLPPNIVIVISDDHGYPDFGFMGSELAETPNLDRLAEGGIVFTQGYSVANKCRPSLNAILTGLYPLQWRQYRRDVLAESNLGPVQTRAIIQSVDTLPRRLGEHGYASFQAGKYWEGHPTFAGFSAGTGRDSTIGRSTLEPVFQFLEEHRDDQFLLWYAPQLPHIPHNAPEQYASLYADSGLKSRHSAYLANVSWFDAGVGQLVERLEALGLRERTLIVLLSDNGWDALGAVRTGRGLASFLGGEKGKGSLYELGFRTPIVFNWPGHIESGLRSDALVSTVDLFPTLLDYSDAGPTDRWGKSLKPIIEGRTASVREHLIGSSGRHDYFLRDHRWHYLKFTRKPAELYDIIRDPHETQDVAAQNLRVVARADAMIEEWVQKVGAERVSTGIFNTDDLAP